MVSKGFVCQMLNLYDHTKFKLSWVKLSKSVYCKIPLHLLYFLHIVLSKCFRRLFLQTFLTRKILSENDYEFTYTTHQIEVLTAVQIVQNFKL